jgi:hypothetical protein
MSATLEIHDRLRRNGAKSSAQRHDWAVRDSQETARDEAFSFDGRSSLTSAADELNPSPALHEPLFNSTTLDFAYRALTRKVFVANAGQKFTYSCWMQKKASPLVCYIPSLGSDQLDNFALAYAEMMFRHGYSVVTFLNPFHSEIMRAALTRTTQGNDAVDCDDLVSALKLILADVREWEGDKIAGISLTGISDGAYFTLLIAAREAAGKLEGLTFNRYVAVNPPVRLTRTAQRLQAMLEAPRAWPSADRRQRMEAAVYKALSFARSVRGVWGNIPLTRIESDFLIGLSHIVNCHQWDGLSNLRWNVDKSVLQDSEDLVTVVDLEQYTEFLRNNSKIRVQICEDDFSLTPGDVSWFRSTFGRYLNVGPRGGDAGNLGIPDVQEAVLRLFEDESTK